jgi:hypothetical protein
MRRSLPALLFVVAGLLPAANAFAQTTPPGGVTIDPNSPSGTEYDIPVQKARRDAQGTKKHKTKKPAAKQSSNASSGDDSSAPLFGAGVQPDPPGETTTTTARSATTPSAPAKPRAAKLRHKREASTTPAPSPPTATTMSSPLPSEQLPPPDQVRDAELAAKAATADEGPTPVVAIAGGAVVLLFAGLSGWWLRRRSG